MIRLTQETAMNADLSLTHEDNPMKNYQIDFTKRSD